MNKIDFFEILANSLINQMPKGTLEKLTNAPEKQQEEIIGKVFDIAEDFFKKEFIKYTIAVIKENKKVMQNE